MNQPPEVINDLQLVDRKYRAWCKRRGFKTSQFVEHMDFRSYGRNEE